MTSVRRCGSDMIQAENSSRIWRAFRPAKVEAAIADAYQLEGIFYIRVWLNEGRLEMGDDIMYVLIGGDIRPHVVDALQYLVGRIKNECVIETELNEG